MNAALTRQADLAPDYLAGQWPHIMRQLDQIDQLHAASISKVVLCGCGDSHHAAKSLCLLFQIWSRLEVHGVSSLQGSRYLLPGLQPEADETLVIGISSSGEVARTLEALEIAGSLGMPTIAVTSDPESSLARKAKIILSAPLPELPKAPGLLNYLGALLMATGICGALGGRERLAEIDRTIQSIPGMLEDWITSQAALAGEAAETWQSRWPIVFLGAGPLHASALFAAAKVAEATGVVAWGQDLEEWAHIEYFMEPAGLPTWLLSARGRSYSREMELEAAAETIGRSLWISRWSGAEGWPQKIREALSPFFLWAGPAAFADALAIRLGEHPYRGFSGGRSIEEGGGASRIRSSARISDWRDLDSE